MASKTKRKKNQARWWSVWCESAGKQYGIPGADHWIDSVHLTFDKARKRFLALQADYVKAELRDPTNHVLDSHDDTRVCSDAAVRIEDALLDEGVTV